MQICGLPDKDHGRTELGRGRAAVCINQPTAALVGDSSLKVYRLLTRAWGELESLSHQVMQTDFMPPLTLRNSAAFIGQTTRGKRGVASIQSEESGDAEATLPKLKLILKIRTLSIQPIPPPIVPQMAARPSPLSKVRPEGMITTPSGSIPLIQESCFWRRIRGRKLLS